jgi:hypothetical protein
VSPLFRRRRQDDLEETGPEVTDEAGTAQDEEAGADDVVEAAPSDVFDRSRGPWDVSEVESTEGFVDLGAVLVPGREGMELRLEIDEAADRVTSATVQLEGSAVQLQVFAAPRTEGIWDEIRAEIAAGITRQGGTADEVPGPFGRELIARIPVRTADGRTGHQPARFAGVDGPRWFLRAVFHGLSVHEPEQAAGVEDVVRGLVVVRGAEAMAPRELLSLRLPEQPQQAEPEEPEGDGRDPLQPFTRGPEITEIH